MNRRLMKDGLGWGFALWLVGYVLSMLLFAFVPPSLLGWIITPIATALTLWVAFRKVTGESLSHYALVALLWMLIAVIGDYLFIVKAFHPADGYYKADVYLYYALTIAIPLFAGWMRTTRHPVSA